MGPMTSPRAGDRQPITREQRFVEEMMEHRELLLGVAARMTGSRGEAEDLVQETLLKALRASDRLRPDSQLRPWLLRILRNTYISQWRRRRREREVLQQGLDEELARWLTPSAPLAPERPDADLGDEVIRALGEVPQSYRTCVLLVDLQEKSYQEAARLTNQPLGTVQSRLFRGRRILKGLLRDYARREGYLPQAA